MNNEEDLYKDLNIQNINQSKLLSDSKIEDDDNHLLDVS